METNDNKTVDGFDNFVSRVGLNNNNTLSQSIYTFNLITRNRIQLEAAYRGSWIVGQVVDTVAEDMTRAGIDINTNEGEDDIKDIYSMMSRLKIWNALEEGIKWGRLYGGALGIIQIAGQDLATPLNLETIGKGQFQGLAIYDRWQLNPIVNDVIHSGPDMGLPRMYQIISDQSTGTGMAMSMYENVHHSRVIRFDGIKLPYYQAITEMLWGESVLERMWDRLISFDNATMSAANLVERANNRTVGVEGLRDIIAAGGKAQQGLEAMFAMMREFQTNEGLTLLDKNDTFATTSYTFAGLADVLLQFGQQLSGASGIPLVRLFGQSPAGLSATGDADMRIYYDNINSQQESKLRTAFDKILLIMWRSTFGKPAPDDLDFTFTPLWQMSAKEKADIARTTAETVTGTWESGLIDKETALQELRQSASDTGIFTNISDEDITEAEGEAPPMPDLEPEQELMPAETEMKDSKTIFEKIKSWAKR